MTSYKLTYFDFDGGRGEPVRIALHAAGIEFEDERWAFPVFQERRGEVRFNALPVLEIDGIAVTQSNAQCRYVGKLAGLYPKDDLQALYCDEVMGAVEDLTNRIVPTFSLEGEALKSAREELVSGWLSTFISGIGELLERGGEYFADDKLTVADLKVFYTVRWLTSGSLDHIPADLVERLAPNLVAHASRIEAEPVVTSYYDGRA
jgi:glutathione S-transferase